MNEETILMLDSDSNGFSATATCTIENPSTYSEEISISYDGDGFTAVGTESATLDAGDSVDILVAISSTSADATLRNVTVDVDVTSVQGAPLPDFLDAFLPSDSSNIMAQVGEFVDLRASLQEDKLTLSSELMQPMSATLLVSNDGNVDDDVSITIQNAAQLEERNIGWNITNSGQDGAVQSNGGSATYTLRFNPNPDMMDESISVVIRVTSSFDNSQSTEVTLTLNTTAPEESILDLTEMNIPSWAYIAGGTLSFLVLVAIMASIRKRIKGASGAIDFDDDDDGDDDFDFDDDDLDDELEDDLDDLDDLDDFEF